MSQTTDILSHLKAGKPLTSITAQKLEHQENSKKLLKNIGRLRSE